MAEVLADLPKIVHQTKGMTVIVKTVLTLKRQR